MTDDTKNQQRRDVERTGPAAKRTYRTPVLIEYGTVAKLTRSNGSTVFENSSGSVMQMMCL